MSYLIGPSSIIHISVLSKSKQKNCQKKLQIISLFIFLFGGFVFGISPKIGFIFEGLFSSSSASKQPSTSKATKSSFQSKVCLEEKKTCIFWTSNHSNLENVLTRYLKIILKRFRWKMKNCYLVVDSVRNLLDRHLYGGLKILP